MKVRKLAVALALAGGLGSGMANALGLGEIELQSWLNEPLDAEITLRESQGVNPNDLFVNVAPEAAYERVGLERNQFLSKLRFEVVTGPDGGLVINVTSREPLREPYLNFLLEMTWPSGRLMREYAVLVDPPVYAEESGLDEPVTAPTASARTEPAPERNAESSRRQAQAESSLSRRYGETETYGPTGPSDTLWSIAQRMRPDSSVSMHQMMLAIQEANPDAFMGGNINRLMQGKVLRVPTEEQINNRSRREADRMVARQNQEFRSPAPSESAAPAQTAASEQSGDAQPASQDAGESELKLLVAEDQSSPSRDAEEGGSAGGDGDLPGGQDAGEAVAGEELDALRRENQELDSRLNDLQDQVQTLQRLLELKDDQLAQLQGMTEEQTAAAGNQPASPDENQAPNAGVSETAEGTAGTSEASAPAQGDDEPAMTADAPAEEAGEPEATDGTADAATVPAESAQTADSTEAAGREEDQATSVEPVASQPAETQQQPASAPEQKSFPANMIDLIMNNPLYQIALGGGLVLLLLILLLVSRRRANKEKEFFNQFADEPSDETDDNSFDISLEDEAGAETQAPTGDALEEAEKYLAYGQHPQAAEVLESAISREPSRTDLRLKLLAVYADSQDAESFDKQYNELAALDDEDVTAQANDLRVRLEEAASGPSIDDLESQLRSDTSYSAQENGKGAPDESSSEEFKAEEYEGSKEETLEDEFGDLESDVAEETDAREEEIEFDLSLADLEESEETEESGGTESYSEAGPDDDDFGAIEFEFESDSDDDQASETGEGDEQSQEETDLTEDWSSLELEESPELEDMASEFEETASEKPEESDAQPAEDDLSISSDTLDDSFLDELDADLDKVTEDEPSAAESESEPQAEAPDLSNLDMDLSDEDLAIMDELSDAEDVPSLEEEIEESEEQGEAEGASGEGSEEPAVESEPEQSKPSALDLDETDLGDDDDFDFLAGTDEAATKLDLARAYVEMGDSDGARDILEEVAQEGSDEQKAEAQELLKNLS